VNDPDRKIAWPGGNGTGQYMPEGLWGLNDFTADGELPAAEPSGGLVSFSFFTVALRRRKRLWLATGAVGLLLGCGLFLKSPPAYQATTSLLLTPGPYENIQTTPANDQAMAQSVSVAALAVRKLGLTQSASSFLSTYKSNAITERVLTITVSARSSQQAVLNASAVAAAFLQFRAQEMQSEQKLVLAALNQQVNDARQRLDSINAQLSQVSAQPATSARQSQLKNLQAESSRAASALYQTQQAAQSSQSVNGSATSAAAEGSVVMDAAAPLAHSRFKKLILEGGLGLIGGLILGMGLVVIQALVSDRLRRRDDIAQALGSPVRLSVGAVRPRRRLPVGRKSAAADIQRIAGHLRRAIPGSSKGAASLAVVPVDDLQVPASSLVSLALACAQEGQQVVLADLCPGAPAARMLGIKAPGVHQASADGAQVTVAVSPPDEVVPAGPSGGGLVPARGTEFTQAVAAACEPANLLVTLITLDPSLGGEHLATWATDAVVLVTAGRSSWTRIRGVAEMVRLSGTRLVSAVLVGTDATDETLGTVREPETV